MYSTNQICQIETKHLKLRCFHFLEPKQIKNYVEARETQTQYYSYMEVQIRDSLKKQRAWMRSGKGSQRLLFSVWPTRRQGEIFSSLVRSLPNAECANQISQRIARIASFSSPFSSTMAQRCKFGLIQISALLSVVEFLSQKIEFTEMNHPEHF